MKNETIIALSEVNVDTEGSIRRFSGNLELYGRFLMKFLSDENYGKIIPALKRNDLEEALMATHTLKGVSANLGMNRLFKACSNIVENIRKGNAAAALELCGELEASYREIYEVLSGEFK